MGIAKVSNILSKAKDYKLNNDERMLFDWLVVKQEDFGIEKPFRHSIKQIKDETNIVRYSQEKAIKHFASLGFLAISIECYENNPFRTYFVDFNKLSNPQVLGEIIKPGTKTFSEYLEQFNELAEIQAKSQKPLSRYKQKQIEKAKEETDMLYKRLCAVWNHRVDMYNKGELTGGKLPNRTKTKNQLPIGVSGMRLLYRLRKQYDNDTISNAFVAYADKCIQGEIAPNRIFAYFLTNDNGDFKVVDDMINYYAINYGKSRD